MTAMLSAEERALLESAAAASPIVWDEPRPWPTLDREALYGLAGDFVVTVAPHSESDVSALLAQFLCFFGCAAGASPHVMVESTRHHARINVLVVGATAGGRKGTSLDQVRRVFRMADDEWLSDAEVSGLASGEGLIARLQDRESGEPVDKRVIAIEPEFARTLTASSRDGSILSAIIRDSWDQGRLQNLTRKNPQVVHGAHVSINGHITGDEFLSKLQGAEIANGYVNRFCIVCAKRRQRLPHGGNLTDADLQPVAKKLRAALDFAREVKGVRRTEAADVLWESIYDAIPEPNGMLGAVTARAEAQMLRLSLIYALLDKSRVIDASHLRAAVAFWEYCSSSAKHIFGASLGDDVADRVLEEVRNVYPEGMDRQQLRAAFSNHVTAKRLNAAVKSLTSQGLARCEQVPSAGRPRDVTYAVPRAKSVESVKSTRNGSLSELSALNTRGSEFVNIAGVPAEME